MTLSKAIRAAVANERLRAELAALVESCEGVTLLPLKSAQLDAMELSHPERAPTDLDVLVRHEQRSTFISLIKNRGYEARVLERGERAGQSYRTPTGYVIDVHTELFAPYLFRMPAEKVWGASLDGAELFNLPVRRLNDVDLYAHLLGKWALDGGSDLLRREELRNVLGMLLQRHSPQQVAKALSRRGMRRALFAFPEPSRSERAVQSFIYDPTGVPLRVLSKTLRGSDQSELRRLGRHLHNHSIFETGAALSSALKFRMLRSRTRV